MKTFVIGMLVLTVACTKPNPNRCCTDAADCMAQGLPADSQCADGLLCRGNQCIAQTCSSANECDASAPFCINQSCTEMCTADDQCPGFGGDASHAFCASGACVQCRTGSIGDCSGAAPVCDAGACRACRAHAECASGVCGTDGSCVAEDQIAYVDPTGSASSECTKVAPCSTIARGLAVTPIRPFVLIGAGNYSSASALSFVGKRSLIGRGPTQPVITRSTSGTIVSVTGDVDATFENLQFSGASNTTNMQDGTGVSCASGTGTPNLTLRHVTIKQNASHGLAGGGCIIGVYNSALVENGGSGASIGDCTATFDGNLISQNLNGLGLDSGLFKLTNNIIARNYNPTQVAYGIDIYSTAPGNQIEFNTIVDNSDGAGGSLGGGILCNFTTAQSFPNNIIARNKHQTVGSAMCAYPSSVIVDAVDALKFRSPDSQPFDYHLQGGSTAIDAATISPIDHDFDGDARPQGNGKDVGADEFKP